MKLSVIISFLVISSFEAVTAQNAYVKLGQQALMEGDFKKAASHLERACLVDSTNANALWLLGYSYYHSENYRKSIAAYNKELAINPTDAMAYYYRARSKSYLGKDNLLPAAEREKYLLGSIFDLTKAIAIEPNATKYQTRGIAYREYGVFKLQAGSHFYDRSRGINSLKASINDLQKVLADNPSRSDISSLLELSKQKLDEALVRR
ncbi:MAG TPA: tetratricopeptide repeat protein [Mucilaginibacter sp.]|nr:tetratricopeptide repeat protein [Mucilaginibacter sp.]